MKTIWKRFTAKTPSFFKKMRTICAAVATASTAGYQVVEQLPAFVVVLLPYGVTAGIVGTLLSQLTVQDPENLQKNDTI